jgi:hypothetical protein
MERYKAALKRIGLTLVWLANVATILGWAYIAVYYWGSN